MNRTLPSPSRRRWLQAAGGLGLSPAVAALPLTGLAAASARAQSPAWPQRPITLLVPFAPGGIADVTARTVAEPLARSLGQAVVVENKPSAGSIVATQALLSAKPDGHTLLLISNAHAISATLMRKLPYDTARDLLPVSTLGHFDLGLFVPAGSRFTSLAQLLQAAKAAPGTVRMGTIAVGSTQHLAAKLFESLGGADFLTVPYKGTPAVLGALRGGEIDVAMEIVGPVLPQVQGGAVRALATTGTRRMPLLPEVPTLQQAGLGGGEVSSWNAIAVAAGTPAPVVERLNQALQAAVGLPATAERLERLGMRLQAGTPEQARSLLAQDTRRWGDVIRAAKIEPE